MLIHIKLSSFDELCPRITWIQRAPGHLGGGTPLSHIMPPPADMEERASHHYARPLLTWRRMLRTTFLMIPKYHLNDLDANSRT